MSPTTPIVRKRIISIGKSVRAPVHRDDEDGYLSRTSTHYIQPTGSARWEVLTEKGGKPVTPDSSSRTSDKMDPAIHGYKTLGDARAALAVILMEIRTKARGLPLLGGR